MLIPFLILQALTAQIDAADIGAVVYRSRSRALPEGLDDAVFARIETSLGELYTVGGSCDWNVSISVSAVSRRGDEAAAAVLESAHNALIADMTLGGIPGLFFNPAFDMSGEVDDTFDDCMAMTAIYKFQITTESNSASL